MIKSWNNPQQIQEQQSGVIYWAFVKAKNVHRQDLIYRATPGLSDTNSIIMFNDNEIWDSFCICFYVTKIFIHQNIVFFIKSSMR